MKKITVLLIGLLLASVGVHVNAQRIKGSDTVLPIAQQTAERFMQEDPDARVTVTGGGSGVGISALLAKKLGEDLTEAIIAYDALAVVVHPSNPVNQLTREQLEGIFRGKITNWKEVGGEDRKIVVYSRETSSGTYEFFKESVLKNKNYMAGSLSMPATGAIIQSVSQTKGAIGYVGLAYVSRRIKTLAVSYDGKHFAQPTLENAIDKSYPIVRPLYYYYNVQDSAKVAPLMRFILSEEGQEIIKKSGYVPVK